MAPSPWTFSCQKIVVPNELVHVTAFTDGVYNGSSMSSPGINNILLPIGEMPIDGGTGVFERHRYRSGVSRYIGISMFSIISATQMLCRKIQLELWSRPLLFVRSS